MKDPFLNAQEQLAQIAKPLGLKPDFLRALGQPRRVLEVNLPVKMDNGQLRLFKGWRSQHNNALGPFKGGIRFHPQVSKEEVMALSVWMTWKGSVAGLPLGGGKGGVIVDPKSLSRGELKRLSQAYARAIAPFIGERVDVPAPDVNTNAQIMDWMLAEYEKWLGRPSPATFTGKSLKKGGSLGREAATGQGGLFVLQTILKELNLKEKETGVAVQGFGNVGFHFARLAHRAGLKVAAVADSQGGVYRFEGLDPRKLMAHKQKTGSVVGFPGTKRVSPAALLELPVAVVVPAALENVIDRKNAGKIKAKIVLELANGPTTPEADKILWRRKVWVVPDILANAGGVTVSFFEWQQNLKGERWSEEEVNRKLKRKIVKAAQSVWQTREKHRVNLRTAAYLLAVDRVVRARQGD